MNALLATHFPEVNEKFIQCKTVDILLVRSRQRHKWRTIFQLVSLTCSQDLFFKYSLNNFLHAQVEQCMFHILAFKPVTAPTEPDGQEESAPPPSSDEDKVRSRGISRGVAEHFHGVYVFVGASWNIDGNAGREEQRRIT